MVLRCFSLHLSISLSFSLPPHPNPPTLLSTRYYYSITKRFLFALRPLPSPSDSYQYINIRSLKRKPTKSIDGDSFLGTDRNREKKRSRRSNPSFLLLLLLLSFNQRFIKEPKSSGEMDDARTKRGELKRERERELRGLVHYRLVLF